MRDGEKWKNKRQGKGRRKGQVYLGVRDGGKESGRIRDRGRGGGRAKGIGK